MGEEKYYAALGLEMPDADTPDEASEQQEVVEPAQDADRNTDLSENGNQQEVVEPAVDPGNGAPGEIAPQKMSREERARQAKERRRRETQQAVDEALQRERTAAAEAHEREMAEIFAAAGMVDRLNGGKKITNKQEFDAWQQAARTERLSQELRDGRLTPESLQELIEQNPTIQAAKAVQDAEKQRVDTQKAESMRQTVQRELEAIHALDPSVETVDDILKLPTGEQFRELVQRGNLSFWEAFRLANFDRLQTLQAAQARQGRMSGQSKEHLRALNPAAAGGPEISDKEFRNYKTMCPWLTDEQIREDFARRTKGQKG